MFIRLAWLSQMKMTWSESFRWYATVVALAAVLVLLAVLQYRSGKAVSEATIAQMRASLQGSLWDVRQGLERELTSLCREMQSGDLPAKNDRQEYAVRFEQWRRAATHPNLVSAVFIWEQRDTTRSQLFKLNTSRNAFETAEWPANLSGLRERLTELRPAPRPAGKGPGGPELPPEPFGRQSPPPRNAPPPDDSVAPPDSEQRPPDGPPDQFGTVQRRPPPGSENHTPPLPPQGMESFSWMIDQTVPALLQTFSDTRGTSAQEQGTPSLNWIIIVLDRRVLGQHILPELVQRYFGRNEQSSYDIAVIDSNAQEPDIYTSRPGFNRQKDFVPDAVLNLFGRPAMVAEGRESLLEGMIAPGAQVHGPEVAGQTATDSSAGFQDEGPFQLQPLGSTVPEHVWKIIARHRQGSVEAAVAALSRRNLIFNFAVLLVLAATMGMIIATTVRGRRFSRLQMDFVANVSHELRTPLTGIISAAQNIADGLIDDKQRMAHYGHAVIGEAQLLSDMVEQILLFSAIQKDRHRYHLQPVDVAEIIGSSLKNMSPLIRSAGITVERQIQPGLPMVAADFNALSHCLQNLISNAVKYGGDARWVGIRARVTNESNGSKQVEISVSDRGIGIRSEDLKQIFEPFYRSAEATAAQIHGSGLGLPLAKKITEAVGGRLTVQSEFGHGSTFTVHLPVK
jgi:signal transduction histidine kinase